MQSKRTAPWLAAFLLIVAAGLLSRAFHTGFAILDKYAGDALYAAMIYALLRAARRPPSAAALLAAIAVAGIECFQLTGIPAEWQRSDRLALRLCARLAGTQFAFLDLAAYAVGIACVYLADAHAKLAFFQPCSSERPPS